MDGWSASGVGWHGGNCGYCDACRHGDAFACETETRVTGVTHDGGYADYMIAAAEALAAIPEELSAAEAAPLMCATVTMFNALRNSGARPGEVAALLGLGGLGHFGVQFAAARFQHGRDRTRGGQEPLARQPGARHYIGNAAENAAAALLKLGGAKVILATATSAEAMNSVQGGLATNGTLMVIGLTGPIAVDPLLLIRGRRSVKGRSFGDLSGFAGHPRLCRRKRGAFDE
jgi:D-arabinose 1-dehydrogenase-like Zn-dependent alcohol dehydrogenase